MPTGILERLSEGVVLGDGGYLLERGGGVQAGPFVPETSLRSFPSSSRRSRSPAPRLGTSP
jgi:hypothetical protein